jgi:hypothetical protein
LPKILFRQSVLKILMMLSVASCVSCLSLLVSLVWITMMDLRKMTMRPLFRPHTPM